MWFSDGKDIPLALSSEKMKKIKKKFFQKIWPPLGPKGYPISGPPDRISKNPSIVTRDIPFEGPMQNFIQFGPVVSSSAGIGTKIWLRIL